MEKEKNIILELGKEYINYLEGIGKKEEAHAHRKGLKELQLASTVLPWYKRAFYKTLFPSE